MAASKISQLSVERQQFARMCYCSGLRSENIFQEGRKMRKYLESLMRTDWRENTLTDNTALVPWRQAKLVCNPC